MQPPGLEYCVGLGAGGKRYARRPAAEARP
jgi:hypothetical protein